MPKIKNKISFDQYFTDIYQDRWDKLKKSMTQREKQVLRATDHKLDSSQELDWLKNCRWYEQADTELAHQINDQGLKAFYIMSPASILAARALEIKENDKVLDMCAAPGGKTLILHQSLSELGELWANEISASRRQKLISVIRQYLLEQKRQNLFVKGKDGIKYGLNFPETFDKILIDAPCSGERHLLQTPKELKKWSTKRTKRLAAIQYGLVCSALLALKKEGQMLYSTCSISPMENDGVIEKLLNKKGDQVKLDLPQDPPSPWAEKTKYGYIHLPDTCDFGPIYFSRLKKI